MICFDSATANRLYRAVEEKAVLERQVEALDAQVKALERKVQALDDLIKSQDTAISQMDRLMTDERTRCEQMLEQAKPSFFDEAKKALGYTGLGVAIGVALFAL